MSLLAQLISTEAPRLPALALSIWWLHLGWAVVLAWLAAGLGRWTGLPRAVQLVFAAVLALWTCLPGPYAPSHWLGLAFQAPSISLVLLCALDLYQRYWRSAVSLAEGQSARGFLVLAGVLLGWVLLLDTFAVFPVALYAWGFSPAVPVVVVVAVLLPWALRHKEPATPCAHGVIALAMLVFAALRLPSGNAWDALLDPWLWLALHVLGGRMLMHRQRCRAGGRFSL
ncbi:MAG: hypothetical protein KGN32_02680 [Burkholderiales bacterium]|nr:hypothetical protein [Burkholderiales bacterium]